MDDGDAGELLGLVGRIYDAALDPELWPAALEDASRHVGVAAANLFSQDIESGKPSVAFRWGVDLAYEKLYLEKYYRLNPLAPFMAAFEVGVVHTQSDVMPHDEFRRTRFYQEWVRPQGFVDVVGVNLERSATRFAMAAFRRHEREGPVTDDTRRRVAAIAPHMRRAVLIGQVLDFNVTLAASLTETLDALTGAVALVDARGRMAFANRSARALLGAGDVARDAAGVFQPVEPGARQAVLAAFAAAAQGDAAVGVKGAAIHLTGSDGQRWIANVLPLTSGAREAAGRRHAATAAVFVRRAELSSPTTLETIARRYRLTPSELRVLHGMVEVGGVPATAAALGVSETTVKTHLQNLYVKTGVNRQAELVKLVASASSGLPG